MKRLPLNIATVVTLIGALMLLDGRAAAAASPCVEPPLSPEFAAPARADYPSFCSIPPTPKNVPPPQAYRAAVVETRLAGAALTRQTAADTWSLAATPDFASSARREGAPPPAPAAGANSAAFMAKARALAKPPPKPRRR